MNVLFHLPRSMRERCFASKDIAALREQANVILTDIDTPEGLETAWFQHAPQASVIITGWDTPPLTTAMLTAAANLKLLVHSAGSVKALLANAPVWEYGIRVTSANEALATGVAESTLGLMIAGLKGFFSCAQLTRAGGWKVDSNTIPGVPVREMFDIAIGLVGGGAVGREVLRLLQPFEVDTFIADPFLTAEQAHAMGANLLPLDALLSRCDIVSLHAPSLPQTRHMISRRELALLKDQAILINTARGSLIDEAALVDELSNGRIWAMLDVTDPEPPALDHPLRTLPNVFITPHIAGAISNGCQRMGRMSIRQILAWQAGLSLPGEITQDMLARIA